MHIMSARKLHIQGIVSTKDSAQIMFFFPQREQNTRNIPDGEIHGSNSKQWEGVNLHHDDQEQQVQRHFDAP